MGHKCFISFKKEDEAYKKTIQSWVDKNKVDMIDKSLNTPIDSDDEDYIMRKIREDYLSDSTVTIFLIGARSSENLGWEEQKYIKRELQASLYDGQGNSRSGILGVVLPNMYSEIYKGTQPCLICHGNHNIVDITDRTVIKEFGRNYYLNTHGKCAYSEDDRYCVLAKWSDFAQNPNGYIEQAFNKRSQPIANEVVVRPK
jgi:hypothetical protein